MRIYKYPLQVAEKQIVSMPMHAKILCVQNQKETACIWAQIGDRDLAEGYMRNVEVAMFPTGVHVDELSLAGFDYLGTIQVEGGLMVFHFYYKWIL